jgi:organic hydroperoxide reductase OsmC/OhrA
MEKRQIVGESLDKGHEHRVVAWWTSGQTGLAKTENCPNAIHFTAPPEFGGLEGRWTPEDLLITALASCFTTTFHAIAGNSQFGYSDLAVEGKGIVRRTDRGYRFSEITLRPCLTIAQEEQRERAGVLLERAKVLCLVARTLAVELKFEPQVELKFEPQIEIGKHTLARGVRLPAAQRR